MNYKLSLRKQRAALQETGDIENSAPQIVMDMKDHLREQHTIANDLRQTCDGKSRDVVEKLNNGFSTTLYLLDAAILGNAIISPKAVSDLTHWNNAAKATLDAQLNIIRKEIEQELKSEMDQEMIVMNSERSIIKEKNKELVDMLSKKDEEMRILRSSLKESSVGYISGDDSDIEDDADPTNVPEEVNGGNVPPPEQVEEILLAKDKAEKEAKDNAERLANAKVIISSLEQSNKTMTEDLKSRWHDSNAAIVSLLDQSGKHEKETEELKSNIDKLKIEKTAVERELKRMKKTKYREAQLNEGSCSSLSVAVDNDANITDGKSESVNIDQPEDDGLSAEQITEETAKVED